MEAAALAALWATVAGPIQAHAKLPPPTPSAAVLAEVSRGKVGRMKLPEAGVAAFGVLPASRELLWLSLTDDHLQDDVAELEERVLRGHWASPKTMYERIDLPWPFADRHWILVSENNGALAKASGVWERAWHVDNSELAAARAHTDPATFDAAQALPLSRGDWLLVTIDAGTTLAVYQSWTDLGGAIPAEAAASWARASLDDLYSSLLTHSTSVKRRYGPGCEPQPGPDGAPIPCF